MRTKLPFAIASAPRSLRRVSTPALPRAVPTAPGIGVRRSLLRSVSLASIPKSTSEPGPAGGNARSAKRGVVISAEGEGTAQQTIDSIVLRSVPASIATTAMEPARESRRSIAVRPNTLRVRTSPRVVNTGTSGPRTKSARR